MKKESVEKKYFIRDNTVASWWKPTLLSKYREYAEERLECLEIPDFSTDRVLEIGVGYGRFAIPILSKGCIYVGIDLSVQMIQTLQRKAKEAGFQDHCYLIHADGANLPFKDNIFDKAVCFGTIVHIPTQQDVISEMGRVTKQDGLVFVEFHNILHYSAFKDFVMGNLSKIIRKLFKKSSEAIVPWHPVTPMRAVLLIKKANLKIINVKGYFVLFSYRLLANFPKKNITRFFSYGLKNTFLKWFAFGIIVKAKKSVKGKTEKCRKYL